MAAACFPLRCCRVRNGEVEFRNESVVIPLQFKRECEKTKLKVDKDLLMSLNDGDTVTVEQDGDYMIYAERVGDTITLYDNCKAGGVTAMVATYVIL